MRRRECVVLFEDFDRRGWHFDLNLVDVVVLIHHADEVSVSGFFGLSRCLIEIVPSLSRCVVICLGGVDHLFDEGF